MFRLNFSPFYKCYMYSLSNLKIYILFQNLYFSKSNFYPFTKLDNLSVWSPLIRVYSKFLY